MNSITKATGVCLCGKVEIHAATMSLDVGACHCSMCRTWSGGPMMTVDCHTSVEITGTEYVSVYESSEWAERGFCNHCGTHLFYRLKQNDQYIVPAGLFGDRIKLNFDHQVFIDDKPEYYTFANKTKNMTGEEVFAQFAAD